MSKRYKLTISLVFLLKVISAQNLVPNGNFESYSSCPTWYSLLYLATPWYQPTIGTTDYFNGCSTNGVSGVPVNWFGNVPARSGAGYAGFYAYVTCSSCNSAREYVAVELASPLIAGLTYHVNFYVRPGWWLVDFATSSIGVHFSDSMVTSATWDHLPVIPQVENPDSNILLHSSMGWRIISGNYTAAGGEKYITIGNFRPDSLTILVRVAPSSNYPSSYYYIDDVCVSLDSTICLVPPVGIKEMENNSGCEFYPNPFNSELNITNRSNKLLEVFIYDMSSRKVFQHEVIGYETFNTIHLSKGLYIYEIRENSLLLDKVEISE